MWCEEVATLHERLQEITKQVKEVKIEQSESEEEDEE